MFFKLRKTLSELEKRIESLEKQVYSTLHTGKKTVENPDSATEKVTVAVIVDEWINGEGKGGK